MRKKNIIKQHTIESVDVESGEIVQQTTYTTQKFDAEPEYIKLYMADMSRWANLAPATSLILAALLRYMNYYNIIPLNGFIKKTIADNLNTTIGAIDVQLNKLIKKGLLTRVGKGTYMANPNTFGRGKWTSIKEIRATVVYNKDGVSFSVATNPAKQLTLDDEVDSFERLKSAGPQFEK